MDVFDYQDKFTRKSGVKMNVSLTRMGLFAIIVMVACLSIMCYEALKIPAGYTLGNDLCDDSTNVSGDISDFTMPSSLLYLYLLDYDISGDISERTSDETQTMGARGGRPAVAGHPAVDET